MPPTLRWGILGPGGIAAKFARGLTSSLHGRLVAVGSRDAARAAAFGAEHGLEAWHCHGSYAALLRDDAVDAVYVATPHPFHPEWAIRSLEAGRHVLCEKPVALDRAEAEAVFATAAASGRVLLEGYLYRCHPQTARLLEMLADGAIGTLLWIDATFGFASTAEPTHRLRAQDLGGGAILDIGVYPVSTAILLASAAAGVPLLAPSAVTGVADIDPVTSTDRRSAATLRFPGGVVAQAACAIDAPLGRRLRIVGTQGTIEVPEPWIPARWGGAWTMTVTRDGHPPAIETGSTDRSAYAHEADLFASLAAGEAAPAFAMSPAHSLATLETLDRWRDSAGFRYRRESSRAFTAYTVAGRPLRRAPAAALPRLSVPGADRPVSALVMGTVEPATPSQAAVLYDHFFENGGNAFDTAWHYGSWRSEWLGRWLDRRGVRDQVHILLKGGHTPTCTPAEVDRQILGSLEHLGARSVAFFCLHRDNPEVPVGEFVDVLYRHHRAGRIGAYGGSNWSRERFAEAGRYAAANGLEPFRILSNQLSLARMVRPPWGGCLDCGGPDWETWLTASGIANFAWTSQARGYFARRVGLDGRPDPVMSRMFDAPDNEQRRERAGTLARALGSTPTAVALAWTLARPFACLAVIGPRTLEEFGWSLQGARLHLDQPALDWLDLRSDAPPPAVLGSAG